MTPTKKKTVIYLIDLCLLQGINWIFVPALWKQESSHLWHICDTLMLHLAIPVVSSIPDGVVSWRDTLESWTTCCVTQFAVACEHHMGTAQNSDVGGNEAAIAKDTAEREAGPGGGCLRMRRKSPAWGFGPVRRELLPNLRCKSLPYLEFASEKEKALTITLCFGNLRVLSLSLTPLYPAVSSHSHCFQETVRSGLTYNQQPQ